MEIMTYSHFRANLKQVIKSLKDSADVLTVTNKDSHDDFVVLNRRDYEAMVETEYIQSQPELMEKIRDGRRAIRDHNLVEHDTVERG